MLVQKFGFTVLALFALLPFQSYATKDDSCLLDQFGRKIGAGPQLIDVRKNPISSAPRRSISTSSSSTSSSGGGIILGTGDMQAFNNGTVGIPGGLKTIPVQNQQCVGFCWSYGGNGFADSIRLNVPGAANVPVIVTSQAHSGYWHFYQQVYAHPTYFLNLAKRVQKNQISLKAAVAEAKLMISTRPGWRNATAAGFTIQEGSDEATFLNEASIYGMDLLQDFNRPIATPQQDAAMDAALSSAMTEIIQHPNINQLFAPPDAMGANSTLYNLLNEHLAPFFSPNGAHPPLRPGDTVTYNGAQLTPLQIMTDVIGFNPADWVQISMTKQNQPAFYKVYKASLDGTIQGQHAVPVPVGFAVYAQQKAQQVGGFFVDNLASAKEPIVGGHEIDSMNYRTDAQGNFYPNDENSWGTDNGRDVNGNVVQNLTGPNSPGGYYPISPQYFNYTLEQGQGPDIVVSAKVLSDPEFQGSFTADPASVRPGKPARQYKTGH